jgi:hypothetical protein
MNVNLEICNKKINHIIKDQVKLINKKTNDENTVSFMYQIIDKLKDTYNITKQNSTEIIIKVDRKKNAENIKNEILNIIEEIVNPSGIKVSFLFKVFILNNEIFIRKKR